MSDYANKLTELFSRFPGVGQRQAKRFVNFLLFQDASYIEELADKILNLKKSIAVCQNCFRFFFVGEKEIKRDSCSICKSKDRDNILMVVSRDIDLENIEKAGAFKGKYFVLGGTVPILDKTPKKKIRIEKLLERVKNLSENGLKEIILAMDFNPEGENTADFIKKELKPLKEKFNFSISLLGKGLSLGSELEYSDPETIKSALENRR